MGKKILIIGGTGVIGSYLVDFLLEMDYCVDVVARHDLVSTNPRLTYIKGNFVDFHQIREFLADRHYDGIVDFMTYNTPQFAERYELLFSCADHFVFVSSYRVYADKEIPTKENSPRLLDAVDDKTFLASDDYSLFKSREENIIRSSKFKNWTIVRPAITYSDKRIAFITLELPLMLRRARAGKPIYIPQEAIEVQATCTWGGDVAKMIAKLLFNPMAYCEAFSVCTAEHRSWGTIAEYYKEIIGADIRPVPIQDYLDFFGNKLVNRWQLIYDRCLERVMDNAKVLVATGMKQSELLSIREGIEKMIAQVPEDRVWNEYTQLWDVDAAMDAYTKTKEQGDAQH